MPPPGHLRTTGWGHTQAVLPSVPPLASYDPLLSLGPGPGSQGATANLGALRPREPAGCSRPAHWEAGKASFPAIHSDALSVSSCVYSVPEITQAGF